MTSIEWNNGTKLKLLFKVLVNIYIDIQTGLLQCLFMDWNLYSVKVKGSCKRPVDCKFRCNTSLKFLLYFKRISKTVNSLCMWYARACRLTHLSVCRNSLPIIRYMYIVQMYVNLHWVIFFVSLFWPSFRRLQGTTYMWADFVIPAYVYMKSMLFATS